MFAPRKKGRSLAKGRAFGQARPPVPSTGTGLAAGGIDCESDLPFMRLRNRSRRADRSTRHVRSLRGGPSLLPAMQAARPVLLQRVPRAPGRGAPRQGTRQFLRVLRARVARGRRHGGSRLGESRLRSALPEVREPSSTATRPLTFAMRRRHSGRRRRRTGACPAHEPASSGPGAAGTALRTTPLSPRTRRANEDRARARG
jgi:hypothetical protein